MKALGVLGIWLQCVGEENNVTIDDNFLVLLKGEVIPRERITDTAEGLDGVTLIDDIERTDASVRLLEIDLEGAWNDMNLDAGWNNEVSIDVYIS